MTKYSQGYKELKKVRMSRVDRVLLGLAILTFLLACLGNEPMV